MKSTLNSTTSKPPQPSADHRELGSAQDLFLQSPYSPGSPLFLPNGAYVFNRLVTFLRAQYAQFGFREVITPNVYKQTLWETSGHWENYKDDMFEVKSRSDTTPRDTSGEARQAEEQDENFGLKPMNCPGHCLLFASAKRSYRDLPIRYADFSALHRNEISGALSGLTRVRRFHQDDGHIFCRPSQIQEEIKRTLDFVGMVYDVFGLGPYKLVLSTRPEKDYIGSIEEWNRCEEQLKSALDATGRPWDMNPGDGAFYGPKIDIILEDSDGKEHQTATVQLDFQLPQRFGLSYTAPDPESERKGIPSDEIDVIAARKGTDKNASAGGPVTPVIIHRAILGSVERFMALLIEHYNGVYPFWLSPRPCVILTLSQDPTVLEYAQKVAGLLSYPFHNFSSEGYHDSFPGDPMPLPMNTVSLPIDVDVSARPLGKKIAEAKAKGYNLIGVVGKKEVELKEVSMEIHAQKVPHRDITSRTNSGLEDLEQHFQEGDHAKKAGRVSLDHLHSAFAMMVQNYE